MTATVHKWNDADFLHAAYMVAIRESDDPDTTNGAIIVNQYGTLLGSGANSFPPGVTLNEVRLARPLKYEFMEHAERKAIYRAARSGNDTAGATLYCPYACCHDCARAVIECGITRVVADQRLMDRAPDRWRASIDRGNVMLDEAGVRRTYLNVQFGGLVHRFDSADWCP